MTVPVRTEKYLRQGRQRYGIGLALGTVATSEPSQRAQRTPSGQR